MATSNYIKQGEIIKAADVVAAFDEKANDADVVKLTGNQTIAGTKTFSTSPVVPSKTAAAANTGTAIATEAQVYLKANIASPTFTGTVSVPSKTSAATNSGTLLATEAQVYLKANDADVVKLTGNQTIAGTKTFSTSPVVPSKTAAAANTGTAIATEAQVYLKANDADVVKLTGNQTIAGTKTFSTSPLVPSKSTAAADTGTAIATESQVYLKANIASPTFTGTVSVPSKTSAATNSGTLLATEAQVYLKANIASPTFTGTPKVPSKTAAAKNDGTLIATEAQVYAISSALYQQNFMVTQLANDMRMCYSGSYLTTNPSYLLDSEHNVQDLADRLYYMGYNTASTALPVSGNHFSYAGIADSGRVQYAILGIYADALSSDPYYVYNLKRVMFSSGLSGILGNIVSVSTDTESGPVYLLNQNNRKLN